MTFISTEFRLRNGNLVMMSKEKTFVMMHLYLFNGVFFTCFLWIIKILVISLNLFGYHTVGYIFGTPRNRFSNLFQDTKN